jgi:hypothetical protein
MNTDFKFKIQLKSYDEFNNPVITVISNMSSFEESQKPCLTIPLNGEDYVALLPGYKEISISEGRMESDETDHRTWTICENGKNIDITIKMNH